MEWRNQFSSRQDRKWVDSGGYRQVRVVSIPPFLRFIRFRDRRSPPGSDFIASTLLSCKPDCPACKAPLQNVSQSRHSQGAVEFIKHSLPCRVRVQQGLQDRLFMGEREREDYKSVEWVTTLQERHRKSVLSIFCNDVPPQGK